MNLLSYRPKMSSPFTFPLRLYEGPCFLTLSVLRTPVYIFSKRGRRVFLFQYRALWLPERWGISPHIRWSPLLPVSVIAHCLSSQYHWLGGASLLSICPELAQGGRHSKWASERMNEKAGPHRDVSIASITKAPHVQGSQEQLRPGVRLWHSASTHTSMFPRQSPKCPWCSILV